MRNSCLPAMLQRGLAAIALSSLFGLGAAVASDTPANTFTTVLKLKNAEGATESLRFDGALAVGESRGYETDAGTPVLVTRTDAGLRIELPSRTLDIALPEHAVDAAPGSDTAEVEKLVRIEHRGDDANETRVVVLHGDPEAIGDAELALAEGLEADAADLEMFGDADGGEARKVVIVRKHRDTEEAGH